MAYTIISQNNTTTTLSDENGNVITVPARVTLATSTDYTIIKVNNNSVDLEDGDGKIIRGVPACVVLAGEGGGSGDEYLPLAGGTMTGDIAFSKTGYNDKVVGNHNGDLRIGTSTTPSNDDLFVSTGSGSDRSISFGDGNGGQLGSGTAKFERTYTQKLNNGADVAVPTVAGAIALQESTMPTADAASVGVVVQYVGTTDANYTNGYFYKCVSDGQDPATYSWSQVSVQPAPSGLPDQTGQSGKFLTTDGTDASWSDKALVNSSAKSHSLAISDYVPFKDSHMGTNAIYIGRTTSGHDNAYVGNDSVGIGVDSYASCGTNAVAINAGAGNYSTFVGSGTQGDAGNHNTGIGYKTGADLNKKYGVAIGVGAWIGANNAIQICAKGNDTIVVNSNANTFKVANANGNFEIMSADGTIPAARHASLPATDGTYVLKLVIASGVPTLSWVAE